MQPVVGQGHGFHVAPVCLAMNAYVSAASASTCNAAQFGSESEQEKKNKITHDTMGHRDRGSATACLVLPWIVGCFGTWTVRPWT